MTSYPILSSHVFRGDSTKHSPKIKPDKIISGIPMPPTVSSYGHGQWSYADKGGDAVTITSSGNQYKTSLNSLMYHGPITQIDDRGMDRWIANSTINPPSRNNYIMKMPDTSYIRGATELGIWLPHPNDTKIDLKTTPRIVEAVDPNRVGFYVSKDANNEARYRKILFGEASRYRSEASEWIGFLNKKGFNADNSGKAGILGFGVEKAKFTAAYYPDLGYLVTEVDFRDKARVLASRYGLRGDEAIEAVENTITFHELAHVAGVKSERLQGLLQAEFYSMMAQRHKGSKKSRIYQALAKEGADYANAHSLSHRLSGLLHTEHDGRLDAMVRKFTAEAEAMGIDPEDAHKYVNDRVNETMGPLVSGSHYSTSEGLEAIAEREGGAIPISRRSATSKGKYEKPSGKYEKPDAKGDARESKSDAKESKGESSESSEAKAA